MAPNRFAAARGRALSDFELDQYIDKSVQGVDRDLIHRLMKFMPSAQRGDLIVVFANTRLLHNNAVLVECCTPFMTTVNPCQHQPAFVHQLLDQRDSLTRRNAYQAHFDVPGTIHDPFFGMAGLGR